LNPRPPKPLTKCDYNN